MSILDSKEEKVVGSTELDSATNDETQITLAKIEKSSSIWGKVIGLVVIIIGAYLTIGGITGATNWTVKIFNIDSELTDATPGVILFVIGLIIIATSRYSFKHVKK